MTRRAALVAAALAVLIALAGVLAAHWASRSEAVLRWGVAQLAQRLPGTLTVTGLHGALDRPIAIDALEYVAGNTRVRARGIELDWSPAALLGRALQIDALRIAELQIATGPSESKPTLPPHLRPPLPVRIERLEIERLHIDNGRSPVLLAGIELSYTASEAQHTLDLRRLDSPWGRAEGRLALQTGHPFPLEGNVVWRAATPAQWPTRADLNLGGTLEQVRVQGGVTVRGQQMPVKAELAPFADVPLARAEARTSGLDLSRWFAQAPATQIDASVVLGGAPLRGTLQATNAQPGPLDRARLPLESLQAALALDGEVLRLDDVRAALGRAGSATGSIALGAQGIDARLQVNALDLRGLYGTLRPTALRGTVSVSRRGIRDEFALDVAERGMQLSARGAMEGGRVTIDEALLRAGSGRAQGRGTLGLEGSRAFSIAARLERLDPAAFGDFPSARIDGTVEANGILLPQWEARARYALRDSRWRGYALSGNGQLTLSARHARDVDARLALGRNVLQAHGAFGAPGDTLQFSLAAPALQALGEAWGGALEAKGSLAGTPERPALQATALARDLRLPGGHRVAQLDTEASVDAGSDPRLDLRASASGLEVSGTAFDAVQVSAQGLRSAHTLSAQLQGGALDLRATAQGGFEPGWRRWLGRIESLENVGREPLRLNRPAALAVAPGALTLGAAQIDWGGGRIVLQDTVVTGPQIRSGGTVTGLPLRKLLSLAGIDLGWENDVLLGGRWRVDAAEQVDGRIEVFRESGDLVARVDDQRLALGLQQMRAQVDIARNRVQGNALVASEVGGTVTARGETVLSRRGGTWGVAGTAPAVLEVDARLESLRALVAAFTSDVVVNGNARVKVSANGTIAEPKLRGTLSAQSIEVEQVAAGVFLREGTVQAEFSPGLVRLTALRIAAGQGEFTGSGEYRLGEQRLSLKWAARELAAVQMPDLLLVVSGSGTAGVSEGTIALKGDVRADKGRVELREAVVAQLGDDVVVVGQDKKPSIAGRLMRSRLDLNIDLGKDFAVSGRGLQARIGGRLHLHSTPGNALRADGEIDVVKGTYEAYGRTLEIEDGKLLFAGAPDNPALDIVALRKNQQVQAGVRVTGTARRPEVRLVSTPEVPDMEKLAWLTLGRPIQAGSQSDTETLQRYAAAMAATVGTGNFQSQVAKAVGLDEIVVLPGTDPATDGGVIQVGKRIGDRIYVVLEQRLSTAQNVLRVNYQLARDWSLRLESGETDAVDLFYSLSFD